MNITFIGGGIMSEALLGGVLNAGLLTPQNIKVGEPVETRRDYLRERYGVDVRPSNLDVVTEAEIVVIAVKPQSLPGVMSELNGHLEKNQAIVSIVAGAKMTDMIQGLNHAAIIRVMPNTPAQIGAGISVWTTSSGVSQGQVELTKAMLGTLGEELYVSDENLLDMATALSASGPAYVFLFIEALIDSAVYIGMPRSMARTLVLQTLLGSTKMALESSRHPAELRDMVTSPGGTTAEALLALEDGAFRATVLQAVIAAYEKSQALGA